MEEFQKCTQEERIKKLEDISKLSQSKLKDIHNVLLPSEYHPDNGLVIKFDRIEKRLDSLEKTLIQIKNYAMAGVGILGGILTIFQIIQLLIK